jgi:hypothetical protein
VSDRHPSPASHIRVMIVIRVNLQPAAGVTQVPGDLSQVTDTVSRRDVGVSGPVPVTVAARPGRSSRLLR